MDIDIKVINFKQKSNSDYDDTTRNVCDIVISHRMTIATDNIDKFVRDLRATLSKYLDE